MTLADFAFYAFAAGAIVSGWRVFRTNSMVRASFLLLLSFVFTGFIMLLLAAPYIGIATIFMMAVEMMVMVLFMVMFMMNPAGLNPMNMVHQHRLSTIAGFMAFAGLAALVLTAEFPDRPAADRQTVIHDLGIELLGQSMLIFESAGITLLATMISAVILSTRSGRFGAADEGSLPPGLEPGGAPAGRKPEPDQENSHQHGDHAGESTEDKQ